MRRIGFVLTISLLVAGCATHLTPVAFDHAMTGYAVLLHEGSIQLVSGFVGPDLDTAQLACEEGRASTVAQRKVEAGVMSGECRRIGLIPVSESRAEVWVAVGTHSNGRQLVLGASSMGVCREMLRRARSQENLDLSALSCAPAKLELAADKTPADLVLVKRGTLPIILTAPHGGHEAIPAVEPRRAEGTTSGKWGGVQKGGDPNTDLLAQGIAAEITKLTGQDPYLVVVKFLRKYIDANRPPELALEDPRARRHYDYYHRSIRHFVDEVRQNHPAGLLIDVHGQIKDRDVVMRGTLNGRGVERLLRRAGVDAVIGPHGVFGQLETNGFKVFPGNDVPPHGHSEDAGFNGGYTVFTYGSHNRDGIDALSMEFGARYRQKAVLEESARGAAKAITAFYEAYLRQRKSR